jgi:hypothetical protein
LDDDDSISLKFIGENEFTIILSNNSTKIESETGNNLCSLYFAYKDFLEIQISNRNHISNENNQYRIIIQSNTKSGQISYPNQGSFLLDLV